MKIKIWSLLLFSTLVLAAPLMADVGVSTNLFQRGRVRLSATGALGTAFDQDYFVMGAGMGYYIANGLEVGVDGEAWWGNNPNIYKLSPRIQYVFVRSNRIFPYVGVFYRRTYFEGLTDLDSYGGRAGIYSRFAQRGYLGVGLVYEKYADCNNAIYNSCSSTYPEFIIGASF